MRFVRNAALGEQFIHGCRAEVEAIAIVSAAVEVDGQAPERGQRGDARQMKGRVFFIEWQVGRIAEDWPQ